MSEEWPQENDLSGLDFAVDMMRNPSPQQLKTELGAQRLRADTAEADLRIWKEKACEAAERHVAAEQRISELTIVLKTIFGMLQHKATTPLELESTLMAHAALNPKPEAASHE